jgi:predicted transcriptional regulator
MTAITLEVPDELASRISSIRDRLPDLISRVLESPSTTRTSQGLRAAATHPAYREMMDFLASSPSPQQIIDFKISDETQDRLAELLDKNREEGLTPGESTELDVYELVQHSMIRLKARARQTPF